MATAPISRDTVKNHKTQKDCWFVIGSNVYDVTKFLDDHPGGMDTLLDVAGGDATSEFEAVGHSASAHEIMQKYLVGPVDTSTQPAKNVSAPRQPKPAAANGGNNLFLILATLVAIAAALYYFVAAKQ